MKRKDNYLAYASIRQILKGLFFVGMVFISIPGGVDGKIQPEILAYGDGRFTDILQPLSSPVTFYSISFIANHLVGYATAIEASSGRAEIYSIEH